MQEEREFFSEGQFYREEGTVLVSCERRQQVTLNGPHGGEKSRILRGDDLGQVQCFRP